MTREEAVTNLKLIMIAYVTPPANKEHIKLIIETFDMAIEALETCRVIEYKMERSEVPDV